MRKFAPLIGLLVFLVIGVASIVTVVLLRNSKNISAGRSKASSNDKLAVHVNQVVSPVSYKGVGFIGSMTSSTAPTSLLTDIKAKYYRTSIDDFYVDNRYARFAQAGGTMQAILSEPNINMFTETYAYPGTNGNWTDWDNRVREKVTKARDSGYVFEYDPWNEGDQFYYNRTTGARKQLFFEMWVRTRNIIKSIIPNAKVAGPSITWYNFPDISAFLLYAKNANALPDILSWHENVVFEDIGKLPTHAEEIRQFMTQNGIPAIPIDIQEYLTDGYKDFPGALAYHLANLERANVRFGGKACWWDPSATPPINHCADNTLAGSLTVGDFRPKATWWTYKAYANMTGNIVGTQGTGDVDGVASYDVAKKEVRVLVGVNQNASTNMVITIDRPANIPRGTPLKKIGRLIPNRGDAALAAPTTVFNDITASQGDAYTITVPSLAPWDGFELIASFDTAGNATATTAEPLIFGQVGDKPLTGNWVGGKTEYPAVVRGDTWLLKHSFTKSSFADESFKFSLPGSVDYSQVIPLACDWDGSGIKKPVAFYNGTFYLRRGTGTDNSYVMIVFGVPSDIPICGNWTTSSGPQTIGIVRAGHWLLRKTNTAGAPDLDFYYGTATDVPVTGKWQGGYNDLPGVYRNGHFLLRNSLTTGVSDTDITYGQGNALPIIGDWNGDGIESVGYVQGYTWNLRIAN